MVRVVHGVLGMEAGDWVSAEDYNELQAQKDELQDAVYDLQMADTHLAFIEKVQDCGLHAEWNAFVDLVAATEKEADHEG